MEYNYFPDDLKEASHDDMMGIIKNLLEENKKQREALDKAHVLLDKYETMLNKE